MKSNIDQTAYQLSILAWIGKKFSFIKSNSITLYKNVYSVYKTFTNKSITLKVKSSNTRTMPSPNFKTVIPPSQKRLIFGSFISHFSLVFFPSYVDGLLNGHLLLFNV